MWDRYPTRSRWSRGGGEKVVAIGPPVETRPLGHGLQTHWLLVGQLGALVGNELAADAPPLGVR